jgi:hypothetical protein
MSYPGPPQPGRPAGVVAPQRAGVPPQRSAIAPQRGGIPVMPPTEVHAPTLGQFWRSDVRRTRPGRRLRWPGLVGFFGGLAALLLLIVGLNAASIVIVSIAFAISVTAGFFALLALVAGLGRALGFFGLLLALAGNIYIVAPILHLG